MSKLSVHAELFEESTLLRSLKGTLDEYFDPAVFDPGGAQYLVFDLAGIDRVTSFGVREWIRAAAPTRSKLEGMFFIRTSLRLVDQFNMIAGFAAGGSLLSFYGAYECEACSDETDFLFDTQLDRDAFESLEAPVRQCRVCGRDAEFSDVPAVVFEYVRGAEPVKPPVQVISVLRSDKSWIDEIPGVRLSMRQSVELGTVSFRLAGIVDESMAWRRIAECGSQNVRLHLRKVSHFDPSGFVGWRMMLSGLRDAKLTIIDCPPVILRRLATDPRLGAGASFETLAMPMRCAGCDSLAWTRIKTADLKSPAAPAVTCTACARSLPVVDRRQDYLDYSQALERAGKTTSLDPQEAADLARFARRSKKVRTSDKPSESIPDKYEILCKLGEGGMAEVHLARQHGAMDFRRLAVIKRVRGELKTDDLMIRMFLDEAKIAARIDHPNVLRVYDLGREAGTFFMVLEFVHGRNLDEILTALASSRQSVPPRLAAGIVADLCKGLARAHRPDSTGEMLVHRDITPRNILVSFDGVTKLLDFGLAGHDRRGQLRESGKIMGSPAWIAPEVYSGGDSTPQADLWGAGLVLMTLLTGNNPFKRRTISATAMAVVNDNVKRNMHWSRVPRRLFSIVKRSLQKDPGKRYPAALAMEADLRAAIPKLRGNDDLEGWIRDLFQGDLDTENEFAQTVGSANLVDALLEARPEEIQRYYLSRRQLTSGTK